MALHRIRKNVKLPFVKDYFRHLKFFHTFLHTKNIHEGCLSLVGDAFIFWLKIQQKWLSQVFPGIMKLICRLAHFLKGEKHLHPAAKHWLVCA